LTGFNSGGSKVWHRSVCGSKDLPPVSKYLGSNRLLGLNPGLEFNPLAVKFTWLHGHQYSELAAGGALDADQIERGAFVAKLNVILGATHKAMIR